MQNCTYDFLRQLKGQDLSNACKQLLDSELFKNEHCHAGVSETIRNWILETANKQDQCIIESEKKYNYEWHFFIQFLQNLAHYLASTLGIVCQLMCNGWAESENEKVLVWRT